jgi:hypothetical protein
VYLKSSYVRRVPWQESVPVLGWGTSAVVRPGVGASSGHCLESQGENRISRWGKWQERWKKARVETDVGQGANLASLSFPLFRPCAHLGSGRNHSRPYHLLYQGNHVSEICEAENC